MKKDLNKTDLTIIDLTEDDDWAAGPNTDTARKKSGSGTQNGPHKKKKKSTAAGSKRKTATDKSRAGSQKSRTAPRRSASSARRSGTKKTSAAARKRKKAQKTKSLYIHIGFAALVLLIGIIGIVKLVRWNRGRESEYDPNDITTEFDTEPEDYFIPLNSTMAEKQKDDGITTILLLGNGSLAKTKGDDDSIGRQIEELTEGRVYDASLDHTYLSVKNAEYKQDYPTDVFSLYWVSYCISTGDFTLLEDTSKSWEGDETVQETVEMLKNLDMSAVDVITIMYDSHDYEDQRILAGPYDETLPVTCCGCLLQSILLLKQAYPHIRIIVSSPYFNYIEDDNGQLQSGGTFDMGQGTLADYMIAYKNIAVMGGVSFIDNYFGTITADNYEDYLEDDREHLNAAGRTAIAARIASFIGVSPKDGPEGQDK